jgi:hypothetical protein
VTVYHAGAQGDVVQPWQSPFYRLRQRYPHARPKSVSWITHDTGWRLGFLISALRASKFIARLDGRELCLSTKPFLDAARVLLAEGVDPATVLQMCHEGSATVAMRATVGAAAGLTVKGFTTPSGKPYSASAVQSMLDA